AATIGAAAGGALGATVTGALGAATGAADVGEGATAAAGSVTGGGAGARPGGCCGGIGGVNAPPDPLAVRPWVTPRVNSFTGVGGGAVVRDGVCGAGTLVVGRAGDIDVGALPLMGLITGGRPTGVDTAGVGTDEE